MAKVAASYDLPVVVMHNRNSKEYSGDIIDSMRAFFLKSIEIAENAGINGDVVLAECVRSGLTYNAKTDEYVDPFKEGIIEPTLVQTEVISNSVSIAGIMLATSGANIKVDDDKKAPAY